MPAIPHEQSSLVFFRRKYNAFAVLAGALLSTSCSLIPLQAARIDVVLHYRQTYELDDLQKIDAKGQRFGPGLLVAAFGRQNYCSLPEKVRDGYQGGLMTKGENRWTVDGLATAVVSPSPWWIDGFIFEAHGRYLLRDHDRVIATSDFYIAKQSTNDIKDLFLDSPEHKVGDRSLRWIDLLVRQIIIREVDLGESSEDKRFVYVSDAVFRVYIMPLNADGVFMIAPVKHEIGIVSPHEPEKVYSVGCVEFSDLTHQPKIFDVRKRDSIFRTNDYPELLQRAGIHEHSESFSPQWYGQSCASDERRPLYRAGSERSAQEWKRDQDGQIFERLFDEVDDSTCDTWPKLPTGS